MKKVLLVEDDLNLQNLYTKYLTSEGFDVLTARDKDEGLKLALEKDVSFILLDVILASNTNGLDLLDELRSTEKGQAIPVVILTNVAKDEEKDRALKLGAKEYLVKASSSPEEVVKIVKEFTS